MLMKKVECRYHDIEGNPIDSVVEMRLVDDKFIVTVDGYQTCETVFYEYADRCFNKGVSSYEIQR